MGKTAYTVLMLASVCIAQAKDREWKLGRVLDSTSSKTTFETGSSTNTTANGTATAGTSGAVVSTGGGIVWQRYDHD